MANLTESSSRIRFTSPEVPSGAFIANSWPATYYIDVGNGEEITNLVPHGEVLLIFTKRSIYMLSGDGVGGQWNLDLVDNTVGAAPFCATIALGNVFFMNEDGIFTLAGATPVNISHPAISELWDEVGYSSERGSFSFMSFDASSARLITSVSHVGLREIDGVIQDFVATKSAPVIFAYNLKAKTWDRFGYTRENFSHIGTTTIHPLFGVRIKSWAGFGGELLLLKNRRGRVVKMGGTNLLEPSIGDYTINALMHFIRTHRYFINDPQMKTLRNLTIFAKKTGDFNLRVLPLVDDEEPADAIRRNAGDDWTMVTESAISTSQKVIDSSWLELNPGGLGAEDIKFYFVPYLWQINGDTAGGQHMTSEETILMDVSMDTTYPVQPGEIVVIRDADDPIVELSMLEGAVYDGSGDNYDEVQFADPNYQRLKADYNAEGRSFSLFITTMGNIGQDIGRSPDKDYILQGYAHTGVELDIAGWGLWVIPSGAYRL